MLRNYFKVAIKVLLRRKFFTFISLFGISFTLLVLMVAAAMLDHDFAPRAPETRSARSLLVLMMRMSGPYSSRTGGPGYGFLDRYVRTLPDVERVAVAGLPNLVASYHEGAQVRFYLRRTDGEFWRILEFDFLEGAAFTSEDDRNGNRVAVINEGLRERLYGGAPAVGRSLQIDGDAFRIVGVVRNVPITRTVPFAEVWAPIGTIKSDGYKRELIGDFIGIILARSADDFPAIQAELRSRIERAELPDPKFDRLHGAAETLFAKISREVLTGGMGEEARPVGLFMILLGAMLLFMLLPTINLININLSRILERSSEIGVRKAFGASSWTLVGQFIVENVILTLVGGGAGLALSALVLAALNASGLIAYADFGLNLRIFGYGLLLALFFGVLSGAYPAWRMSRLHPVVALRGRTQ